MLDPGCCPIQFLLSENIFHQVKYKVDRYSKMSVATFSYFLKTKYLFLIFSENHVPIACFFFSVLQIKPSPEASKAYFEKVHQ